MKRMSDRRQKRIEKNVLKNRNYKKLIYNRMLVTVVLVLLQIALSGFLLFTFYNWSSRLILLLVDVFAVACILYIINKYEKPSDKLNWVIIILVFPLFGIFSYAMFGDGRPTKKMKKRIRETKEENKKLVAQDPAVTELLKSNDRSLAICRYLNDFGGYPACTDGEVVYYETGEKTFAAMMEEIEKAKKFILLEYFIVAGGKMWDTLRKALVKKAEEGVKIRMIFDDWGCILNLPPKYEKYLEALHPNIKCLMFNQVLPIFTMRINNRTHRKFVVVDGECAFTGGINIADEYVNEVQRFGYWKDTGVKVTGSAVNSFTMMFYNLWNAFRKDRDELSEFLLPPQKQGEKQGFFVQPYDDSPLDGESVGETVYLDVINRAKKYVYIFTPYLIVDDFIRNALCAAAKRGVDVRIVTPGIPDKKWVFRLTRANYPPLLKAGVKIYEYTPGFIHAKSMVTDDESAVVGTFNIDYRSLYLHFEDAVYFTGTDAVLAVKKDCEETFALSHPVSEWDIKRSLFGRLVDSLLRVFETTI